MLEIFSVIFYLSLYLRIERKKTFLELERDQQVALQ